MKQWNELFYVLEVTEGHVYAVLINVLCLQVDWLQYTPDTNVQFCVCVTKM